MFFERKFSFENVVHNDLEGAEDQHLKCSFVEQGMMEDGDTVMMVMVMVMVMVTQIQKAVKTNRAIDPTRRKRLRTIAMTWKTIHGIRKPGLS